MLVGVATVAGRPIGQAEYLERFEAASREGHMLVANPKRRERDQAVQAATAQARAEAHSMAGSIDPESGAISLADADLILVTTGARFALPCVRVPL
jgi:hypothetical protein